MLEVRRLQIFAAVAERGSFTAAAEALYMTHSAVSQQMALLERQLGIPLMVRGPRGVELTEAGRLLADRSASVLGSIAAIEQEMRDLTKQQTHVRLGVFPTAAADLIPRVVKEFQRRHPDIRVRLRSAHATDIPAALRDGEIQLGLIWDYDFLPRTIPADIERLPLVDDPLCVLVPAQHPLAAESEVDLVELAGETWVVRGHEPPYEQAFATMCRLAGFEPQIGFVTEDYLSAQGLVAAGIGVTAVPRLALVALRPDVAAVPIGGIKPYRRIAAVRRKDVEHSAAALQLLEVLRDVATGEM
ncbi:LysR family transcriptional regulator [Kibdelosporangium philippinense]|uniref:LysR family transcriptional regulator n=1 Tax=Kibdelosporangium philippinense TaxID=211113 RepID=A0ABS8Z5L8_9PSEU|nr:LysR family transcriptional regulator [Kibdelosporangium philippinense]MCE7002065.1 LysR family transcriptional regulator [Kibdelosporangium philippinense]